MPGIDPTSAIVALLAFVLGGGLVWTVSRRFFRARGAQERLVITAITERLRAVGKLVGLEVCAKEIATTTSGWGWMPPLLLSQARLAMIFNFEKQYYVDLTAVRPADVEELGPAEFRVVLPPLLGQLRLLDVTPYDIQNARVLGLLDVIPMTADRQREMMRRAQDQAAELFRSNDTRYLGEAKLSVERHLRALMDLFGVKVQIEWSRPEPAPDGPAHAARELAAPEPVTMGGRLAGLLVRA
ncbi:MAG: DUF4230 domain-containing protein [Phycisphaerales bacterium]